FEHGPLLALQQDLPDGSTTLRVTGTQRFNDIDLRSGKAGAIKVDIDDLPAGSFTPSGRLVVHGGGDDTNIDVSDKITLPALIFADGRNGHIQGGGGATVEVGAGGGDTDLVGGRGRSILIAGSGRADLSPKRAWPLSPFGSQTSAASSF